MNQARRAIGSPQEITTGRARCSWPLHRAPPMSFLASRQHYGARSFIEIDGVAVAMPELFEDRAEVVCARRAAGECVVRRRLAACGQ